MDAGRVSKAAVLTEVNGQILETARKSIAQEQDWEFFCECGGSDCHEHVTLTIDAYSALHDDGGVVLALGHRLSQRARATRLIDEADALRRQAQHQIRRATKLLGESKVSAADGGEGPAAGGRRET